MDRTPITKYLKFNFQFNVEKLTNELNIILAANWVPHFNKENYSGDWNSIALYAVDGNEKNIFAHHTVSKGQIKPTSILQHCPYLQSVISTFKCPLESVRLLRLGPGSFIKPHRDYNLGYENGCFRLHVPILTNPSVHFILDGQRLEMKAGECWYTNVNYTHSVANEGLTDRVHLVIDGQRNQWSDDLFFSLASRERLLSTEEQNYTATTIKRMIGELERQENPGAKQLIDDLKNKLTTIQ